MKIGFLVSYSIVLVGKGSEVFIESYEGSCFVFDTMDMGWVGGKGLRVVVVVHRRSGLTVHFLLSIFITVATPDLVYCSLVNRSTVCSLPLIHQWPSSLLP